MPVICIGPVCIPLSALLPLIVFFFKPLYNLLLKTRLGKILPPLPVPVPEEEPADSPIVVVKSEEQWEELRSAPGTLVVQFTATWCGPCKRVAPVFAGLARAHSGPGAAFVKVDIDAAAAVADECDVAAVPQFHVFRDGKRIAKMVGAKPQQLEQLVKEHCGAPAINAAAKPTKA
ncbi:thioredoxin-like protein, partial [Tribonema minus]